MSLPCAVVRDLLPLYAEKLTEDETDKLIHEHLQTCPDCRRKLQEIETGPEASTDAERPLRELKKEIGRRRLLSAIAAALLVFVSVYVYFYHETSMQLIPWQDGLIEVRGIEQRSYEDVFGNAGASAEHEDSLDVLVLQLDGIVNGTHESVFADDDGTHTMLLQAWSSYHNISSLLRNHHEMVLYPVPERLIYTAGGQQQLLWGEPMNGGAEILPRLALAFYLLWAAGLCVLTGAVWFFLRKKPFSWIPRQVFLLCLSYVVSHALILGTRTETFFMEKDFMSILLVACALFAFLSVAWQIFLQQRKQ
ncbi:MAG: zf-HC2 domain-containing protein [Clostridia bacterium]|nr:zf-HC2 domain-containing protein [Clostridia bacterium]